MKKLSLKNLKLETNDMLQRNQLKTVFGGYGPPGSGTCGYRNDMGVICGLSKEVAMEQVTLFGGYWCCGSCASNGGPASYC